MTEVTDRQMAYVVCPECGAEPFEACRTVEHVDTYGGVHSARKKAAIEAIEDAPLLILLSLHRIEALLKPADESKKADVTVLNKDALAHSALELDWSVRTHNIIQKKFINRLTPRVADVVAIPPAEWLKVPRCGMLVLREMDKMFKELGVEWPGEWPRR